MFGLPPLERIILLAVVPPVVGFFIVNRWHTWEAYVTFWFLNINSTYGLITWFASAYADWKKMLDKPERPEPVREQLQYKDMSEPEYAVETEVVTLDVERNFAAALTELFYKGADYKLTESWWWDNGKWQGVGGSSKKQMQAFLQDWERRGLLEKVNRLARNSTRRVPVGGWHKIANIARGRKM